MANATEIGNRFGTSANDFERTNKTDLEKVVMNWTNQSIAIMRKIIQTKSKVRGGASLAQDLEPQVYQSNNSVGARIITSADYYDYVDKGVKGITKNKAPKSPYQFKNLYTPPAMIESFKRWAAAAGIKSVGNRTLSFKGKKREKALDDQTKVAKQLAVFTKLGGIKPMNYIEPATNEKRIKVLTKDITVVMTKNIIKAIKK
jgi:hypothetical protein